MSNSPVASNEAELAWAFPSVDPGAKPLGARILVQLRRTKKKVTSAGIILVQETKETEKWNNMVAKVVDIGPLAFKKRDTMEPWPERHRNLADVINARCALNLHNLRHIDLLRLTADFRALQLQHRRSVVDVRRVQKRSQSARKGCRQAANQVRQANCIRATPRNELVFNDPVKFLAGFVAFFPVSIQTKKFTVQFVQHQDVRGGRTIGFGVILEVQPCIGVINPTQSIFRGLRFIACNEMLLYKLPIDLYQDVMAQMHHDAPLEEANKIRVQAEQVHGRDSSGKRLGQVEGEGLGEIDKPIPAPTFQG